MSSLANRESSIIEWKNNCILNPYVNLRGVSKIFWRDSNHIKYNWGKSVLGFLHWVSKRSNSDTLQNKDKSCQNYVQVLFLELLETFHKNQINCTRQKPPKPFRNSTSNTGTGIDAHHKLGSKTFERSCPALSSDKTEQGLSSQNYLSWSRF